MLVTAVLHVNGVKLEEAVHGSIYTVTSDTGDERLTGKLVTVVAGPHDDFGGSPVYTCSISGLETQNAYDHDWPFFNKRWRSAYESVKLCVCSSN